jgi:hypothetical protein
LTCLKEELYGKLTIHDRILCMDGFRPLLQGGHRTSCDRNDLIELLPDLDYTTLPWWIWDFEYEYS